MPVHETLPPGEGGGCEVKGRGITRLAQTNAMKCGKSGKPLYLRGGQRPPSIKNPAHGHGSRSEAMTVNGNNGWRELALVGTKRGDVSRASLRLCAEPTRVSTGRGAKQAGQSICNTAIAVILEGLGGRLPGERVVAHAVATRGRLSPLNSSSPKKTVS